MRGSRQPTKTEMCCHPKIASHDVGLKIGDLWGVDFWARLLLEAAGHVDGDVAEAVLVLAELGEGAADGGVVPKAGGVVRGLAGSLGGEGELLGGGVVVEEVGELADEGGVGDDATVDGTVDLPDGGGLFGVGVNRFIKCDRARG